MPVADLEYNTLKLFVENVSLPLIPAVAIAHQNQLKQMANQASANLSNVHLNQPAAAASSSAVPLAELPPQRFIPRAPPVQPAEHPNQGEINKAFVVYPNWVWKLGGARKRRMNKHKTHKKLRITRQ